MKQIKLSTFRKRLLYEKFYMITHKEDLLDEMVEISQELSEQAFGSDMEWIKISDIIHGIMLYEDCPIGNAIRIFELLEIDVVPDEYYHK